MSTCALCGAEANRREGTFHDYQDVVVVRCGCCGEYGITHGGLDALLDHPEARWRLRETAAAATASGRESLVVESVLVHWAASFERTVA